VVQLTPRYLGQGYFDEDGHVRATLLTTAGRKPDAQMDQDQATDLDRALCALRFGRIRGSRDIGIKVAQLRRFYNHAKQLEGGLRRNQAIEDIRPDLQQLEVHAASVVGRGVACEPFLDFMRANVRQAQLSARHFQRGFIPHFEAVVAYMTYYWGESERRS
jgi:CRISPR type III-A-associated protein Csm2